MAIDHTQLRDVPRRLGAGRFAPAGAGTVVIGDRLPALARAGQDLPDERGSVHRLGRR